MIKKALRYMGIFIISLLAFISIYFLAAFILSRVPVNSGVSAEDEVQIYLLTNGIHADLVLPVRNRLRDWSKSVKFENTEAKDTTATYIGFGWGDKGFYMHTPTWADLTVSTAFSAAFALGGSAMHATFHKELKESENCKAINISYEEYGRLIEYIDAGFKRAADGSLIHIVTDANYGPNDAFYEAVGHYSLFKTCNTWTNSGLKACGQKACLWTPFDNGIFYHYRVRE